MTSSYCSKKYVPVYGLLLIIAAMLLPATGSAQASGEQLFQSKCAACHTIGGGRLIGPDLAGVADRRTPGWLVSFVQSSQSVASSGDAVAVALFEEFSGIIMPDFPLPEEQITQILGYIDSKGSAPGEVAEQSTAEEPAPVEPVSMESVLMGQKLFQGTIRFENNGPTCNSCHDVKNDAVIGGGILAAELTNVFTKIGGSGVGAILGQAPFPVMQIAYRDRVLTKDEITYLVAFLQDADEKHLLQKPRDYGMGLFVSGAVGAGVIYLFFAFIWRGRKRGSVYQGIYDRQIKSYTDNSTRNTL